MAAQLPFQLLLKPIVKTDEDTNARGLLIKRAMFDTDDALTAKFIGLDIFQMVELPPDSSAAREFVKNYN